MPSTLFLLLFYVCLFFLDIDPTFSLDNNPKLRLSIYPNFGYSTENIEIRCEILQPSIYDNIYLFVKTDNVKPSGILVMLDTIVSECRINENKQKYIQMDVCNSSLILFHVNHEIINDSLHTIEYACSQGETNVFDSYRILKEQTARYYDQKSLNSSSSKLTHTLLLLLLFMLTIIR